jgi:hypothetical protein
MVEWPCVITADEYGDIAAFLELLKRRIKRDIRAPEPEEVEDDVD